MNSVLGIPTFPQWFRAQSAASGLSMSGFSVRAGFYGPFGASLVAGRLNPPPKTLELFGSLFGVPQDWIDEWKRQYVERKRAGHERISTAAQQPRVLPKLRHAAEFQDKPLARWLAGRLVELGMSPHAFAKAKGWAHDEFTDHVYGRYQQLWGATLAKYEASELGPAPAGVREAAHAGRRRNGITAHRAFKDQVRHWSKEKLWEELKRRSLKRPILPLGKELKKAFDALPSTGEVGIAGVNVLLRAHAMSLPRGKRVVWGQPLTPRGKARRVLSHTLKALRRNQVELRQCVQCSALRYFTAGGIRRRPSLTELCLSCSARRLRPMRDAKQEGVTPFSPPIQRRKGAKVSKEELNLRLQWVLLDALNEKHSDIAEQYDKDIEVVRKGISWMRSLMLQSRQPRLRQIVTAMDIMTPRNAGQQQPSTAKDKIRVSPSLKKRGRRTEIDWRKVHELRQLNPPSTFTAIGRLLRRNPEYVRSGYNIWRATLDNS